MALMTGRRSLMETLKAEGVEYMFGNPGTTESPIMDELESHPELRYMLVLQEGVAMGMADAYARATGNPSFVNLHIETGLGNGMSLLHNANDGGTPLVLTSVNLDVREQARGRTDIVSMVRPLTKWTAEATHPQQVPGLLRRAFNEAKTPPTGPTFIAFSTNALDDEADVEVAPSPQGYFRVAPDRQAVRRAAQALAAASNPVVVVGDRVAQSDASREAVRLAELLGATVYASRYSEMNFPTAHPQFMGSIKLGFPEGRETLSNHDVLLMVGKMSTAYYMFSDPVLDFAGPDTMLVHVDVDAGHVGSTQPTHVGVIGDPKVALSDLADALEVEMSGSASEAARGRAATLGQAKEAAKAAWQRRLKERWNSVPISPERMMAEVATAIPQDAIVVNDAVTTSDALHHAMDFNEPGGFFAGRGGALGWGIGGAMGVKLANPDRPVVAVEGDGTAMMTIQGLWTAANSRIPVVYIVCNNGSYRVLKLNMDIYRERVLKKEGPPSEYLGMDFPLPLNLAGMADAMGVHGRRIEDPAELQSAVRHALDLGEPALLDVVIDGSV